MSDNFAPPVTKLAAPTVGSLDVTPYPTAGQGLALGLNGRIPAAAASYVTYTPVLTASGGGSPTLGNATSVVAKFLQVGKFVHVVGQFILGSTTNFGTGNLQVSLPVPVSGLNGNVLGSAYGFDTSATAISIGVGAVASSGTAFNVSYMAVLNSTLGVFSGSASAPWAWATGDEVHWNLCYEAA